MQNEINLDCILDCIYFHLNSFELFRYVDLMMRIF